MKKNNFYFLIFFALLVACQEKKESTQTESNASVNLTEGSSALENYSTIFQAILKTDTGMARGVKIGDNIDTINETTLPSETPAENGKSFTEYFDDTDLNFADILYVKSPDNKVEAITIDVYIERQTAVDSLMNEFKGYFETKYGKGVSKDKSIIWQLADGNNNVLIQNVSTEKDPGMKIVFANKDDKILQ
ncbi:hypothetical protein VB776_22910 [Arcicella sp. DC2W]|uniref:Lipoprotein n=1 Tax=Arcicella gelida TaxID=2984195 RepID=A0ABU5SBG9_9BACT|nr:hypothetical protein [Arcicella sp. DC2W]MEA5405808.1 hypothetical protein [Arcicella sp. DC2W]